MSYTDYNYQQPSGFDTSGGYSSTYSQGVYDASQYGSSDQYSAEKDQQQYSQYDYSSYSSSYQQPVETSTTSDYYSPATNDYGLSSNSYSQQGYVQPSSTGYDTTSDYQTSSYQYSSNAKEPDAAIVANTSSQDYSSAAGGYDYPVVEVNSYVDSGVDQYEQASSSYNYGTDQNSSASVLTNQPYESLQSYSQPPQQTSSSYSSSQQYSKLSNDYSQLSDFGGYLSSQDSSQLNSYQNPSQTSGYQPSSQRSAVSGSNFQSSQSSTGGYRQSGQSGSGSGYRSGLQSYSPSAFDDNGFGGYSGPASGYSRKTDVWSNSNSGSSSRGGGGGNSSFYKSSDDFGGFSYNPKRDNGSNSFSQLGGSSFSPMDNSYSPQSGSSFSAQGARGSRYNNNSSFNQRGNTSGNKGSPITARNMGSQSRTIFNSQGVDDNASVSNANNWRAPRGGSGPQNRGGFNNSPRGNQFDNHSSPRGGAKFNNSYGSPRDNGNKGFLDNKGGNHYPSRSQNTFGNDREAGKSKPLIGSGSDTKVTNEVTSKKTEAVPLKDAGHHGAFHTNIVKKVPGKDDGGSKAPFYPNQKLLNEIESKNNDKVKQSDISKVKAMTQDTRKETESKGKVDEKNKEAPSTTRPTDQPVKAPILAPPKKAPETPEEIAREEEIQRKILASIVVLDPASEKKMLSNDIDKKEAEVEMSDELRELLKTLTTDHYCKLCNVRLASPQMPVHYNGKNHFKKVRIFAQTNGRSAGFNQFGKPEDSDKMNTDDSEKKEENEEVDEKKYCKICKIPFLQDGQSEIHYKGKNHAKKLRQANRAEIYECKICSVVVSSQEVLTAHLNGAPHKLQIRKMEGDNPHRGGLQGRGGYRGNGRGRGGFVDGGEGGFRGRGIARGRGRGGAVGVGGFFRGFKRPTDSFNFGGSFDKRPRFTNYSY